jgi:dCTP deaminase
MRGGTFGAKPSGGVLVDKEIEALVRTQGLISHFEKKLLKGASYDLRLGREFSTGGEHGMLSEDDPSCKLEPGQFILLTSHERLNLPIDIVGRAGLMSMWTQRGLISLFSPQIDPGFKGLIVVPLFNGGNAPISLRVGEPMFTVEFIRTSGDASFGWAEKRGGPLDRIDSHMVMQMGRPDFSAIGKDLVELRKEVSNLESRFEGFSSGVSQSALFSSTRAVWITLLIAILALVVSILAIFLGDSSSTDEPASRKAAVHGSPHQARDQQGTVARANGP